MGFEPTTSGRQNDMLHMATTFDDVHLNKAQKECVLSRIAVS